MKYYLTENVPGLQKIFYFILTGLAILLLCFHLLKFSFFLIRLEGYYQLIEIFIDVTLAVIATISLLYLHPILKNYITKQNQEYRTLFKENPQAMWIYDTQTLKFLMVNDAAIALYGYTCDEFLRMKVSEIRPIEDIPAFFTEEENRRTLPPYHWSGTWRHKTKNGNVIYAEVSSYEVMFNGKKAALAMSYNITDKVIQELKLITINQELEEKVKDRTNDLLQLNQTLISQFNTIKEANHNLGTVTEELRVANEKLRDHAELKSQFASIVSHEFRSPLSTIKFHAEFIHKNHQFIDAKELLERLERISKTADHMDALLNDVLTIQRSESPKIESVKEAVNVVNFLQEIAKEVSQATKNTHKILIEAKGLPELVYADERLLRNIFINLLSNAVKYSADKKVVFVSAKANHADICFEVEDRGMGIKPEYIKNIFEPFYRTPCAKNIQGTGLGLSIVKRATEALGGQITVKSELGKGSTFKVVLPMN